MVLGPLFLQVHSIGPTDVYILPTQEGATRLYHWIGHARLQLGAVTKLLFNLHKLNIIFRIVCSKSVPLSPL